MKGSTRVRMERRGGGGEEGEKEGGDGEEGEKEGGVERRGRRREGVVNNKVCYRSRVVCLVPGQREVWRPG